MAGLFKTNFVDVVGNQLSSTISKSIAESLDAALSRADILNTFSSYMSLAGVPQQAAQEALNRVDLSIRGLPIGLDEAAQRLRRYQMFLGDIDQATNLTIGVQKAITAGGAAESMRQMAYLQLDRLITTGTLNTQRQWNSLIQGMGVSVRFLAEELGHGEMNASQFIEAIRTGQIPAEDFLQALMSLGEGSSDAAKKLDEALNIYKTTYESWVNNLRYAAKRGMTNVINALSDSLEEETGKTTIRYMHEIRDTMDDMFSGAASFVRSGSLKPVFDSVGGFIDSLRGLSGTQFGESVVRYFSDTIGMFSTALGKLDGNKLGQFAAFASTIAGPLGKLFEAVSSGLPAVYGVFERFKDYDFNALVDSIVDSGKRLSGTIEGLLNLISDEAMNEVISFGLVWGKPVAAALTSVASALMFFSNPNVRGGIANLGAFLFGTTAGFAALGGLAILSQNNDIVQQENADFEAWSTTPERQKALSDVSSAQPLFGRISAALGSNSSMGSLEALQNELAFRRAILLSDRVQAERRLQEAQEKYDAEVAWQDALGNKIGIGAAVFGSSLKAEEEELQKAKEDLASIDDTLSVIDEYSNSLGDEISSIKGGAIRAATEAQAAKSAFDEIDLSINNEDLQETLAASREEIQGYFKGEKDDPFDFGSYIEDRWDIGQWISDYFNKNQALNEWQENVEKAKQAIHDHVNDPTFEKGMSEIIKAGPEALAAYFSATPDQQDTLIQEAFNNWSISDAISAELELINTAIEAYETDLTNGAQSITDAANDLAMVLLNPFQHSPLGYFYHNNGLEPEGDRGWKYYNEVIANNGGVAPTADAEEVGLSFENYLQNYAKPYLNVTLGLSSALDENVSTIQTAIDDTVGAITEGADEINKVFSRDESKTVENYLEKIMTPLPGFQVNFAEAMRQAAQGGVDAFNEVLTSYQPPVISIPSGGGAVRVAETRANGGLIYAANGMFIPVGTDTVPAMLTPGEYVQRKAAVDAFGKDFMDKVNALNIKGAINTLFHRYPTLAGMTYVANDSRSYDNHAAVHMTINNASQYYSQRIADRWVRAL